MKGIWGKSEAAIAHHNGSDDDQIGYKSRVTVVGSGSWGSVAAKRVASNTLKISSFHDDVKMWVFEETLQSGEKLTDAINRTNENVKYLPGIKLGKNVIADPIWTMQTIYARALLLGINCSVLMGANLANEIAKEKFSEATVGYRDNRESAEQWVQLFSTPYFMVTPVQDAEGVELCGTLENVVAIATGGLCCNILLSSLYVACEPTPILLPHVTGAGCGRGRIMRHFEERCGHSSTKQHHPYM
ncbi:hypothetical protein V6N13_034363 [Hibiscus sabdariffa]